MGFRDEWCHVYVPALDCTGFVHASVDALVETNAVVQSRAWVYNPDSADRLNLRQHPSTDAASLGKYYNGVPVDVLELAQNGWVKVRICEAATGYMQAKYLSAYKVATAFPLVYTTHPQQLRLEPRSSGKAIEPIRREQARLYWACADHGTMYWTRIWTAISRLHTQIHN